MSRYEADLAVSVVFFISISIWNYFVKWQHLLFVFSCETLLWSLPRTNKRRWAQLVQIGIMTVCRKTRPPNNNKCVIHQKLKHLDDVRFRELFVRISVSLKTFINNAFVTKLVNSFHSYIIWIIFHGIINLEKKLFEVCYKTIRHFRVT
jgi:hypothetical protein